ncbi:MAG TPA: carboxypeptidase-like regulatory domain-containing protein [Gemmatimonadaceae bacterium]|nr:carboxypeptidase-like regulatory domain-containing protein [Gemmatimonadaceae bacterium]
MKGSFAGCRVGPLLALLVAIGLASTRMPAQAIRVELRDSVTGAPVAGALVSARNVAGASVDGLSGASGTTVLRLPAAGTWALSIRRIGLRPRIVSDVRVDGTTTVVLPLVVAGIRQQLQRVRVVADARTCGRAPSGEDRTAALWEQITLALRAATLTRGDSLGMPPLRVIERTRELTAGLRELSSQVTRDGQGVGRLVEAEDPDSLAVRGYVRADGDGSMLYFAPDEITLLSKAFVETHCFAVPKKDADASLAELTFTPVKGRKVGDVKGTAFVDTASGELRRISFQFDAPRTLIPGDAPHAGGEVDFRRLRNGQWIVRNWAIRMPLFAGRIDSPRMSIAGYREVGGTITPVAERVPSPP